MSETADALASKANVRARVRERATAKRDAVLGPVRRAAPANRQEAAERAAAARQRLAGRARGVVTNPRQARDQSVDRVRRAVAAIRRNPQLVAVPTGLAVLVGLGRWWRAKRSARRRTRASSTDMYRRGGRSGGNDRRRTGSGRRRTDTGRRGATRA